MAGWIQKVESSVITNLELLTIGSGQIVGRSKRLASNNFFERSLAEPGQSDGEVREVRSLPLARSGR
jgi:hypothetical protein